MLVQIGDEVLGTDIGAKAPSVQREGKLVTGQVFCRPGGMGHLPSHGSAYLPQWPTQPVPLPRAPPAAGTKLGTCICAHGCMFNRRFVSGLFLGFYWDGHSEQVMEGLPRGAAVEVQPLAFSLQAPCARDPLPRGPNGAHSPGPDDSDDDSYSAAGPQWVTELAHGTRRWGFESPEGQVELTAEFLSSSRFFRIHISVVPPGGVPPLQEESAGVHDLAKRRADWLNGSVETMWNHLHVLLEEGGLEVRDVVEATVFYNVSMLCPTKLEVALKLNAPEGLTAIPCVPTLAIGPNPSVQAAYQVQLTASTL